MQSNYEFVGGYPTPETVRNAYDDADLARAVQAYKFFYPTVSFEGTWRGNLAEVVVPNKVFPLLEGTPTQLVFTPNSDTPYSGLPLDLVEGPMVVELPPGPLMGAANDLNQRWVMDLGLPGPDAGKGGKHLLLPPGYTGPVPDGFHAAEATMNRVLVLIRAIPPGGDNDAANALMKSVRVYPLNESAEWKAPTWVRLKKGDFTPLQWETNLQYWKVLHEILEMEPPYEAYRAYYGDLAGLGIVKGKPFQPDARMRGILEKAAQLANGQMRVQSFADRRPDRIAWSDRRWEWATLRPENGTFDSDSYLDLDARAKWFFQAQVESPAMFRRSAGAGSLYWLGTRDQSGAFLEGGKQYKLRVPQPVPANLFWSVTVYDAETRSEINSGQGYAALRSMFELKGMKGEEITLKFGPSPPTKGEAGWIRTVPGKGWFAYFRIYGPAEAAFNGTWKPGDFEEA
ncbi:DUF1254 domain-containing protein [Stenotrophomonas aracearum]|uniref:DUF1254 domain-containing protein n=1 Tax=Stenotrophomonas aracearum TaxID=3003272 RepID=A0ABY9Y8T4_9GAMM|nr:DUF1254 domain-containing protein [Stenotrophomonas sp. A5588]WNH47245.1 DUF1254 domain-containing protein [Stenotrophomonas sp. A5588]